MDNTTPNPMPDQMPIMPQPESKAGPIIGIVIVVIVLIIGALYFWGQRLNREVPVTPSSDTSALQEEQSDPSVTALNSQSSSDDYASIESDLNATNVDGLSSDFEAEASQ